MMDIRILAASKMSPEEFRKMAADILGINSDLIYIFNMDDHTEYGIHGSDVNGIYLPLYGDFSFELTLWENTRICHMTSYDFAEAFVRRSGSMCCIDTPDGNPFTWFLFEADVKPDIVEIDDDYRIIRT